MTVRSGLDRDKKDEAIAEIDRQLSLLCDPKNIGQDELENAKLSRLTNYAELTDDPSRYLSWYNSSVMGGFEDSIEELCAALEAVTAEDVAEVARSVKRRLCYFLDGVQ
jgi:predicted Zn-dependent peptidase